MTGKRLEISMLRSVSLYIFAAVFVILPALGFAQGGETAVGNIDTSGETIEINVANDDQAAALIVEWLGNNNINVGNHDASWFTVQTDHFVIVFSPKTSATGLDRLIAQIFLTVNPEYKSEERIEELRELVWKLNDSLNTAQFSLDPDNDIVLLSQLTFINTLTIEELSAFMDWFNGSVMTMMFAAPEAMQILQ